MKFNPITTIIFHQHTLQPLHYMDWFGSHWTMHHTKDQQWVLCSFNHRTWLRHILTGGAAETRFTKHKRGILCIYTLLYMVIVALKILKRKCWIFFPTSAFQPLLDFWNGYPTKWKCKNSNVDILVNSFFCLHCKQQHFLPL